MITNILKKTKKLRPVYEEEYFHSFFIGVFLAAALIFFLVRLSFVSLTYGTSPQELDIEYIHDFIETKAKTDSSAILIGDSRVKHAARFGIIPHDVLPLQNGRNMAVLQFAYDAAIFNDFTMIENSLLMARPDYLLIGRPLLSNDREEPSLITLLSYRVTEYMVYALKGLDRQQVWHSNRSNTETCFNGELTRRFLDLNLQAFTDRAGHNLDPAENENIKNIRRFIEKARKTGIKVVILNIPPNTGAIERFGAPVHIFDTAGLGRLPSKEELLPGQHDKVTWLEYPNEGGEAHYCDFVHLNKDGRNTFKNWFADTMAGWQGQSR